MKYPTRAEIEAVQLQALNELLLRIVPGNLFYTRKIAEASPPREFRTLEDFSLQFPFTTKREVAEDQQAHPLYGQNLTFPLDHYSRLHQTSGTSGKPLRWLDTPESWNSMVESWMEVFKTAGVASGDVAFFAFSFGPFLGFWLAFEAATRIGLLSIPGGGLSSISRIRGILETEATILCCTPSYAVHLAEVAAKELIDLKKSHVRLIIVAGEPGGSLPATRSHIERLWPGAKVFDHHGMTEVGPVTYECPAHACRLHVIHWAYLPEIINPQTQERTPVGERGELVLTTLKRVGSPLIRYRTGDLVSGALHHKSGAACECGRYDLALEGGILGRVDDMVVVRGVNIFPGAVEQIIRGFREVAEYQVRISRKGAMTEMHIVVEATSEVKNVATVVSVVEKALETAFSLRIPVTAVPEGTLPRSELKAKRWIRE